jgi:large subunit ribosomal protein L6e
MMTSAAPSGFFATEDKKEPLSEARKADQKSVDSKLLANIKKSEFLKPYLHARFSLTNSDKPHAMTF